ncbi:hypothetical protein SGPA1_21439 [Streptomyces misionensis JCM 4497]
MRLRSRSEGEYVLPAAPRPLRPRTARSSRPGGTRTVGLPARGPAGPRPVRGGPAGRGGARGRGERAHRPFGAQGPGALLGLRLVPAHRHARLRDPGAHHRLGRGADRLGVLPALPGAHPGARPRAAAVAGGGGAADRLDGDRAGRARRLRDRVPAARPRGGHRHGRPVGGPAALGRPHPRLHRAPVHRARRVVPVRPAGPPLADGRRAGRAGGPDPAQRLRGSRRGARRRGPGGGAAARPGVPRPVGRRLRGAARLDGVPAAGRAPHRRPAARLLPGAERLGVPVRPGPGHPALPRDDAAVRRRDRLPGGPGGGRGGRPSVRAAVPGPGAAGPGAVHRRAAAAGRGGVGPLRVQAAFPAARLPAAHPGGPGPRADAAHQSRRRAAALLDPRRFLAAVRHVRGDLRQSLALSARCAERVVRLLRSGASVSRSAASGPLRASAPLRCRKDVG